MKFRSHLLDDTVKSVYGLAVADINGDGQLDIIAGSISEPIIAWYEAPHWKRHLVTDQGSGHITIAPYDLTGNGTPDLIAGSGFNRGVNAAGGYLHWLEAPTQDGQSWKSHHIADVPFIHRIALANFTSNALTSTPFLIVASIRGEEGKPGEWHSPGSLWCCELSDTPRDTTSWQSHLLDDSLHINHGLSINDVDQDGRDDVLISCSEGLIWYEPPISPMTDNWGKWIISDRECSDTYAADIDGDGINEILAIEPWHGNNLVWYKATGNLRTDPWERHLIDDTLNRGHSLAAVDVDNDGVLEIICGYNGEGTSLHLYRPENLAQNQWHKETIDDGGLGVGQMHVLDMNGNGRLDIVASGLSTGNVKWYEKPDSVNIADSVLTLGDIFKMNKLYFGDNLEILREMDDERVHLICTDPPFNSGRDYNSFIGDSLAQKKAFTDTWTWDTAAQDARADIERRAHTSDTYKALDECLKGYDLVLRRAVSGNKGAMRAYLAFMGPRLAEMHRILAPTGSIYLHCDPTASHYLKGVMDAIWDQDNRKKNEFFRNEIVWCYRGAGYPKKDFGKRHDIILRYSSGPQYIFNLDDVREEYAEATIERFKHHIGNKRKQGDFGVQKLNPLGKHPDDWWQIQPIAPSSKERLGYPTQKPLALYERMIKASSNEGDIVLDPFCGCGTTIDAAHTLNRQWIGIDITILALDPMRQRLADRHGLAPSIDYQIEGYPTNMQEVRKFLKEGDKRKYHDFSNWAVTRLGLKPTRDVGDGGHDGVGHATLWNPQQMKETDVRILAEVKTGKPTLTQVRAFCQVMNQNNAQIGIFITIESISAGMRQQAEEMDTFEHNGQTYPRLQFWQIEDAYFENPEMINTLVRLPIEWRIRPEQKSARHFDEGQMQLLRG